MDFNREKRIYDKLKGSGLCPEITGVFDGAIEHEFVDGETLTQQAAGVLQNPYDFMEFTNKLLDWYQEYRKLVNFSLGDIDFDDFVVRDGNILCIDFEQCKPGLVEDDIAIFAANISLVTGGYTVFGMEDAKIFVKEAWKRFEMNSEKLYNAIKKAFDDICLDKGIAQIKTADEYVACFVCCAFAHQPKDVDAPAEIMDILRQSNQMWTLFAKDVTGDTEKYIRYLMSVEKDDCDTFYLTNEREIQRFPLLFKTESAIETLQFAINMDLGLRETLMFQLKSKGIAIEDMK